MSEIDVYKGSTLPAKVEYAKLLADSGLQGKVAEDVSGCWLWTGAIQNGYGIVGRNSATMRAHRLTYTAAYGAIPDDLHIDHLCRVRACVRPDHLEAVTQAENNRRAGLAHTHCPRGHELTGRHPDGRRYCTACRSEYDQRRYAESRVGVDSRASADRTQCPAGHPYDSANTYVSPEGKRACRICRNEASRRYRMGGRTA